MKNEEIIDIISSINEDYLIYIELPYTPEVSVNEGDDYWLRYVRLEEDTILLDAECGEPNEEEDDTEMSVKQLVEKLLTFDKDLETKIMHPYGDLFCVAAIEVRGECLIVVGD